MHFCERLVPQLEPVSLVTHSNSLAVVKQVQLLNIGKEIEVVLGAINYEVCKSSSCIK